MNKKPLILIADDDDNFREIMSAKLKASGFDVASVSDGAEVEPKLKELGLPGTDLLLLDLQMPIQNGFDTYIKMKNNPQFSHLKIAFLTNYGNPESVAGSENFKDKEMSGINYIKKTDDLDLIVEQVRKIV